MRGRLRFSLLVVLVAVGIFRGAAAVGAEEVKGPGEIVSLGSGGNQSVVEEVKGASEIINTYVNFLKEVEASNPAVWNYLSQSSQRKIAEQVTNFFEKQNPLTAEERENIIQGLLDNLGDPDAAVTREFWGNFSKVFMKNTVDGIVALGNVAEAVKRCLHDPSCYRVKAQGDSHLLFLVVVNEDGREQIMDSPLATMVNEAGNWKIQI